MYCIYCGSQIDDDAQFCPTCGRPQPQDAANPSVQPPQTNGSEEIVGAIVEDSSPHTSFISHVLGQLHDSDVVASAIGGEMRCPASQVQTAFMRLIAKGLLALLCCLCLPLAAEAQKTFDVDIPTPAGAFSATITFEGDPIKWYWDESLQNFKEGRVFTAYGVRLHKGDRFTIKGTVSDKTGAPFKTMFSPSLDITPSGSLVTDIEYEWGDTEYWETGSCKFSATLVVLEEPQDDNYQITARMGHNWYPTESNGEKHSPEIYVKILTKKDPNGVSQMNEVSAGAQDKGEEAEDDAQITIDSKASSSEDEEEEQSWVVPALVTGGVAAGAAAAGAVGLNLRRRRKSLPKTSKRAPEQPTPTHENETQEERPQEDDSQDDDSQDDDDPDKCTYEMRIRKDFGDTLYPGEPNQKIYARIVKIDRRGRETTDYGLTQRIQISADDNLELSSQQMAGDYKGAFVRAHATNSPAAEAIVTFTLKAQGGSFCNRMHFKIAQQMITFTEDELTLPAGYEKTVYLPFEVDGMGDAPVVTAKITGSTYTVKVEHDKEAELYYAIIRDKSREIGTPGDIHCYTLTVTAIGNDGRRIENSLTLSRYTMGLACNGLERVKCYLQEYDATRHVFADLQRNVKVDTATNIANDPQYVTKTMTPAENRFTLSLYEYNEEQRRIIRIPPNITRYDVIIDEEPPAALASGNALSQTGMMFGGVLPPGVGSSANTAVAALEPGSAALATGSAALAPGSAALAPGSAALDRESAAYLDRSKTVKALGLHIDAVKGFADKDRQDHELVCFMVCRGGVLDAPNRLHARVIIEAEHEGRKYFVEQRVLLTSLPYRTPSRKDYDELCQRDKQIGEALERIRSDIYHNFYAELYLLHTLVDRMLSNYDRHYGYDWQQVRGVFRIYNRYLRGQQLVDTMTAEDETLCISETVDRVLAQGKGFENNLSFFQRLILGVATLGGSEAFFNTLEVVHNMKKYVDEGGDSVFQGFVLGSAVPVREYIFGYIMQKGLGKVKDLIKSRKAKLSAGKAASAKKATTPTAAGKPASAPGGPAATAAGKPASAPGGPAANATGKPAASAPNKAAIEEASRKTSQEFAAEAADTAKSARATKAAHETASMRNAQGKQTAKKLAAETKETVLDSESHKLLEAEESGLKAGQDKIKRLREACELPDTPRYRQQRIDAVMEVQKDKNALNLLNKTDDQSLTELRRQFNSDIKKVHYSTEFDMKMELADQLSKDPRYKGRQFIADDIHAFNATSNGKSALEKGSKVAMDYDGSFFIESANGEKIILDQQQVESAFQQFLYRKGTGCEGTAEVWKQFYEATDHTIIQTDLHLESYGWSNIMVLLDPKRAAEALPDAQRAAKAFTDKCLHWYRDGLELIGKGGKENIERGVAHIRESFRQCTKQFENFVVVRDAARQGLNGGSKVSDELFTLINYLKETDVNNGSLKVAECLKGLELQGTSPVRIFQELGNCILEIG